MVSQFVCGERGTRGHRSSSYVVPTLCMNCARSLHMPGHSRKTLPMRSLRISYSVTVKTVFSGRCSTFLPMGMIRSWTMWVMRLDMTEVLRRSFVARSASWGLITCTEMRAHKRAAGARRGCGVNTRSLQGHVSTHVKPPLGANFFLQQQLRDFELVAAVREGLDVDKAAPEPNVSPHRLHHAQRERAEPVSHDDARDLVLHPRAHRLQPRNDGLVALQVSNHVFGAGVRVVFPRFSVVHDLHLPGVDDTHVGCVVEQGSLQSVVKSKGPLE